MSVEGLAVVSTELGVPVSVEELAVVSEDFDVPVSFELPVLVAVLEVSSVALSAAFLTEFLAPELLSFLLKFFPNWAAE